MAIKLGNTDINKLYLGGTEINKLYLGNTEIYSPAPSGSYPLYNLSTPPDGLYGVRQLSPVRSTIIRGIRLSDNAEQDFTEAELTDGTLVTFAQGGEVGVLKLYDQSGNGYDMDANSTTDYVLMTDATGAIYLSDSVGLGANTFTLYKNGSEGLRSVNTNGAVGLTDFTVVGLSEVIQTSGGTNIHMGIDAEGVENLTRVAYDTAAIIRFQGSALTSGLSINAYNILVEMYKDGTNNLSDPKYTTYKDNSLGVNNQATGATETTGDRFQMGNYSSGEMSFMVGAFWKTNQLANRANIYAALQAVYA